MVLQRLATGVLVPKSLATGLVVPKFLATGIMVPRSLASHWLRICSLLQLPPLTSSSSAAGIPTIIGALTPQSTRVIILRPLPSAHCSAPLEQRQ